MRFFIRFVPRHVSKLSVVSKRAARRFDFCSTFQLLILPQRISAKNITANIDLSYETPTAHIFTRISRQGDQMDRFLLDSNPYTQFVWKILELHSTFNIHSTFTRVESVDSTRALDKLANQFDFQLFCRVKF